MEREPLGGEEFVAQLGPAAQPEHDVEVYADLPGLSADDREAVRSAARGAIADELDALRSGAGASENVPEPADGDGPAAVSLDGLGLAAAETAELERRVEQRLVRELGDDGTHTLYFRKPKMFGIWFDMYWFALQDLWTVFGGRRVEFVWVLDNRGC